MDPSSNSLTHYTPPPQDYLSQQGYPPINSYQSAQQPLLLNSNNRLNELDKGWFKCYKIVLFLAFAWRILNFLGITHKMLSSRDFNWTLQTIFFEMWVSMALIWIQFSSMRNRDLKKAKIAWNGFLGFASFEFAYRIFFSFQFFELFGLEFLALTFVLNFAELALVMSGSFKVYQFLNDGQKQCKYDNYESYYRTKL